MVGCWRKGVCGDASFRGVCAVLKPFRPLRAHFRARLDPGQELDRRYPARRPPRQAGGLLAWLVLAGLAARTPRSGRARTCARTRRRSARDGVPLRAPNHPPSISLANRKRSLSLRMMSAAFCWELSAAADTAASTATSAMGLQNRRTSCCDSKRAPGFSRHKKYDVIRHSKETRGRSDARSVCMCVHNDLSHTSRGKKSSARLRVSCPVSGCR